MALRRLFKGKSVNTPSFLLATLFEEGIVKPVPERKNRTINPPVHVNELTQLTARESGVAGLRNWAF
jgi:hypothetical protein